MRQSKKLQHGQTKETPKLNDFIFKSIDEEREREKSEFRRFSLFTFFASQKKKNTRLMRCQGEFAVDLSCFSSQKKAFSDKIREREREKMLYKRKWFVHRFIDIYFFATALFKTISQLWHQPMLPVLVASTWEWCKTSFSSGWTPTSTKAPVTAKTPSLDYAQWWTPSTPSHMVTNASSFWKK